MKGKLAITLAEEDPQKAAQYVPGDTFGGHLAMTTTSTLKYTCIKIRFIGLVDTKIAKAKDEIYVMNQQQVLLGDPSNGSDFVLEEGEHSWPFEFKIPLQHIPSSGKYRHGSVKYFLTASITSKAFISGISEITTTKAVPIRDLINVRVQPYASPVAVMGSSNLKPDKALSKHLVKATVRLGCSGYLKGQAVAIEIDLAHTSKIHRSPGCWIQLIRTEQFYAGEHAKEYSHVIAHCSDDLDIDSSIKTGKITTEITIPDNALPTMTTTKIISIQYHLLVLLDMRPKTPFMEGRSPRKINTKLRNKLLSSPGGFEIKVPLIVGTLSDSLHTLRQSPFAPRPSLPSPPTHSAAITPPMRSTRILVPTSAPAPSLAVATSAPAPSRHVITHTHSAPSQLEPPHYSRLNSTSPNPHHALSRAEHTDSYNTMSRHQAPPRTESFPGRHAQPHMPRNRSHSSHFPQGPGPELLLVKPLPSVPALHPKVPGPVIASTYATTVPHLPPRPLPETGGSSAIERPSPRGSSGDYPREKMGSPPTRRFPLPLAMAIESASAPRAMDLGLGPASPQTVVPPESPSFRAPTGTFVASPASSRVAEYFPYVPALPASAADNRSTTASAPRLSTLLQPRMPSTGSIRPSAGDPQQRRRNPQEIPPPYTPRA